MYYPRRAYSILAETLSAQLENLRAGMWRPDLSSLLGAALLARVEEMEAEGVLVQHPFFEIGIAHHEVCDGLERAGWQHAGSTRAKD